MACISHPIHYLQSWISEHPFDEMILDKDGLPSDTSSFAKKHHGLVGVVDYINEHHNVEAAVPIRYGFAVERFHGHR
jgi:hypothetical protein